MRGDGSVTAPVPRHGKEGRQRMIPGQFDYVRPRSWTMRCGSCGTARARPRSCRAATACCRCIKLRLAQPALLVDIQATDRPRRHHRDRRRRSAIGARTTHRQIHENAVVVDHYPLLRDVAGGIGDPQVRNWGTIGGSCRPRGPVVGLAGGPARHPRHARLPQRRRRAGRSPPATFFLDTFTTAIEPTEVLTEVRFPMPASGSRRRLREARAAGRGLRDGRRAAVILRSAPTAASPGPGSASRRWRSTPFAATDAEAALDGPSRRRRRFRAAAAAAAQSRPGDRQPRSRRLQARDGRAR